MNNNIYSQSVPDEAPNLIPPVLDKLDMPKLRAHAEKYRNKCGISEASQKWWNEHLVDLENHTASYNADLDEQPKWPLQEIIDAKKSAPPTSQEITHTSNSYPGHLMDLDTRPFPQVREMLIAN